MSDHITPTALHLKKTEALHITWADGTQSSIPLQILRKNCPCAGCQGERDLLGRTILPIISTRHDGPITAEGAELVGNYALRINWSDGHNTGLYTFTFLRQLAGESGRPAADAGPGSTDVYG